MEQNAPICQSCGMPMLKVDDFGNSDYCQHCFKDGELTNSNITMEQMIERQVPFAIQMGVSENEARRMGTENLPKLKRWRKAH